MNGLRCVMACLSRPNILRSKIFIFYILEKFISIYLLPNDRSLLKCVILKYGIDNEYIIKESKHVEILLQDRHRI